MAIDVVSRGQGIVLARNATDLLALFGTTDTNGQQTATGAIQPSGATQAALDRGAQAGSIATYATTQSPSIVNANTGGERAMTVQSGTGGLMLPAAGDVFFVNKPTSQAGLGVGNVRVSASNTVQVGFINYTAGNLTPTGSEVYQLVGIRGLPVLSPVLSPASVAAATTLEQQFNVTGLPAGALVQVVKPTNQAGLEIGGVRVVSAGVLGITFVNTTAAPIVPTASETYTVFFTLGLDAHNNDMVFGFNAGAIGAIGAGIVTTGGSTSVLGVLATDVPIGAPAKPTSGAAATNAAFAALSILTANVITMFFGGIGAGATPTASEVYNQKVHRLNPAAPLKIISASLAPASVAANTTAEQIFNVTGVTAASPCWVNKPSAQAGLSIVGVRVPAINQIAITYGNTSAVAIVPTTETYLIGDFQALSPGAGNVVYQSVVQILEKSAVLLNAVRAALVSISGIAGA
jgi:hypothetical protein